MSETSAPNLFADITAKPGMGALFVRLVGPSIGQRETPIIQQMVAPAIDGFGPTLKHVVLDLGAITFMNSTGLGMLVDFRARTAKVAGGAKVILLGVNAELLSLLKMVKFDRLFTIAKDAEALSKAMGR
jgi:anti-anti-sigma factor